MNVSNAWAFDTHACVKCNKDTPKSSYGCYPCPYTYCKDCDKDSKHCKSCGNPVCTTCRNDYIRHFNEGCVNKDKFMKNRDNSDVRFYKNQYRVNCKNCLKVKPCQVCQKISCSSCAEYNHEHGIMICKNCSQGTTCHRCQEPYIKFGMYCYGCEKAYGKKYAICEPCCEKDVNVYGKCIYVSCKSFWQGCVLDNKCMFCETNGAHIFIKEIDRLRNG